MTLGRAKKHRRKGRPAPDHTTLFETAENQHGYFTSRDARQAGFNSKLLAYHVASGRFVPLKAWGRVYRLRDFPEGKHEAEWAALVKFGPHAVLSHETALRLHDLSDVAPLVVHITVPYNHRPRMPRSIPRNVRAHVTRTGLLPGDVTLVDGLPVTTPLRTLLDTATRGTHPEQVALALAQALDRGWVTRKEVERAARARGPKVADRIRTLLLEAGK